MSKANMHCTHPHTPPPPGQEMRKSSQLPILQLTRLDRQGHLQSLLTQISLRTPQPDVLLRLNMPLRYVLALLFRRVSTSMVKLSYSEVNQLLISSRTKKLMFSYLIQRDRRCRMLGMVLIGIGEFRRNLISPSLFYQPIQRLTLRWRS